MATLSTSSTRDGHDVVLVCSGSAETESIGALERALDDIHTTALSASATTVVADVRELEFANSTCLKAFILWVQRVLDSGANYKVVFRSTSKHMWQRRSLGAIAAFSNIVEIRPEAA